jgi:DNA-binding MarR family transcriptional regulator
MSVTRRHPPLPGLLGEIGAAVGVELRADLSGQGFPDLRPGHGCVFSYIDEEGSRLTELAERSGHTKQSVGEAVADLERHGYVERVPDPQDGRAKIIRLTPHGAQALAAANRGFAEIETRFAAALGEERYAQFRASLEELYELTRSAEAAEARRDAA